MTAEDSKNRINDDRRKRMVLQHTAPSKRQGVYTWAKFGTGNSSTLDDAAAAAAGVGVRAALLAYRSHYYRTDAMCLTLIAAASLDELESLARRVFEAETGGGVTTSTRRTHGHPPPSALSVRCSRWPCRIRTGGARWRQGPR